MSREAPSPRLHVTALIESPVVDRDGAALGKIVDIMLDVASGRVVYVALAVGGMLGVGEKLFAVPWSSISVDDGGALVAQNITAGALEAQAGFDKDAWPAEADARFSPG